MEKVRRVVHQLGQGRPLSPGGHGGPSLENEGGIWELLSPRGPRSVATTAILGHVGIGVAAQGVTAAGPVAPLDQHQPMQQNLSRSSSATSYASMGCPSKAGSTKTTSPWPEVWEGPKATGILPCPDVELHARVRGRPGH